MASRLPFDALAAACLGGAATANAAVHRTLERMSDNEPPRSNVDPRARLVAIILVLALIATMAPFLVSIFF